MSLGSTFLGYGSPFRQNCQRDAMAHQQSSAISMKENNMLHRQF